MPTEQVLYRKYRPQSFADVRGQDPVVRILSNALAMNRIAHAYLFSGPRGTGKTSVARIFARAVNCADLACDSPTGEEQSPNRASRRSVSEEGRLIPCNACESCAEFLSGRALDLVEMDAASNRGVDEVRAIREAAELLPMRANYKVYILDEAHMLTREAWNALLKLTEEPPPHVIFILATTEPEKVPDTVQSRVQHLQFRLADEATLVRVLADAAKKEEMALEPDAASMLALFAEGSFRDALNLLGQAQALCGNTITASVLEDFFGAPSKTALAEVASALALRDAKHAIECAGQVFAKGSDPRLFLKLLIHQFRSQFLDALRSGRVEKDAANPFSAKELETILRILLETATERHYSGWRELPIELALHRIVREL
ncbi:MAG: DNA polymerase III subunit gamma/tau [Candidatus Niyogibacteria bacterium]|nr:DNA polymerase III subunit gamma/tau [Candidatus Niyogibacteria bacterium]